MCLGLQRIVRRGSAFHGDLSGLQLKGLLGIGGFHQNALDDQGCADIELADGLEVGQGVLIDHLQGLEVGAVGQDDEAVGLLGTAVADPAADGDLLTGILGSVFKQFSNSDQMFHF